MSAEQGTIYGFPFAKNLPRTAATTIITKNPPDQKEKGLMGW